MKRHGILAILLLAAWTTASAGIEYEFHQTTRSEVDGIPASDVGAKAVIDRDRSRIDYLSGTLYPPGSYVISLDSSRRMIFVDPATKTYSEVNTARVATVMGGQQVSVKNLKIDVQILNDHPIIAGYPTDHYRVHTSYDLTMMMATIPLTQAVNTVIDKWTTGAFGDVADTYLAGGAPRTGNADLDQIIDAETSKTKGFPLRQVFAITTGGFGQQKDPNTKIHVGVRRQTADMTVTSIRSVDVHPSQFQVPADYKKAESSHSAEDQNVHILSMEPADKPKQ
jgi:hypothetical protein